MQYRILGKSGLRVSTVVLGTWAIGGSNWGEIDDRQSIETIRKAIDEGVNLIDTAPVYGKGHSEEMVGKAMHGRRENVIISTKCGLLIDQNGRLSLKPEDIRKEIDDSLRRLNVDVVDLYFCHWPDPKTPVEETMGELSRIKEKGKIKFIGLSNYELNEVKQACKSADITCTQDHYSLLKRDIESGLVPFCRKQGIGILAYAPLGGGILSGKYKEKPEFEKRDVRNFFYPFYKEPFWSKTQNLLHEMETIAAKHKANSAQVAVAWVNRQEGITLSLVGAKNPEQMTVNAKASDLALSEDENALLTRLSNECLMGI